MDDADHNISNCSVYSLAGGSIRFQSYYNGTWLQNFTDAFLPAYYATNCSVQQLASVFEDIFPDSAELEQWSSGFNSNYTQRDNGDAFVALLFTVSGVTVSLWMLTLLLYLLPKHKRKNILVHITTIFASVVYTVLLAQVTERARDEYYADRLDIYEFREMIYHTSAYRICTAVAVFLMHISHMQIVIHITRLWFRNIMVAAGGALISTFTVVHFVYEIRYNDADSVIDGPNYTEPLICLVWRAAIVVLRLLLLFWLMLTVFKFTLLDKNPRKISYALPTLGVGLFAWAVLLANFILRVLAVTLFRHKWWVRLWLDQLPSLMDIALLTILWEWIYNMERLEKKHELMGVLGRRMSSNDVASVIGSQPRPPWWKKRGPWSSAATISTRAKRDPELSTIEIHQLAAPTHPQVVTTLQIDQNTLDENAANHADDVMSHNSASTVSYDFGSESSDHENENTTEPPAFVPLPGFSVNDYWHEKP